MMLPRALRMALLPVQARGFTTTMYGRSLKDEEERQRRPYDATSAVPTHDLRRKRVVRVRRKKQGYTVAAAPKRLDLDTLEEARDAQDEPPTVKAGRWTRQKPKRRFQRKAMRTPSVDEKLSAMLDDEDALSSLEALEALTADRDKLTDGEVARLVTHCIARKSIEHGTLTVSVFDAACTEAEAVLAAARRLGHAVGPEALAVFVVLHANPTTGPARDLAAALSLLGRHHSEIAMRNWPDHQREEQELSDAEAAPEISLECLAPPWVYAGLLNGCALDDDEEAAFAVLDHVRGLLRQAHPHAAGVGDGGPPLPLSPDAWAHAISACNSVASAKRVVALMGRPPDGRLDVAHYSALLRVAGKAKAVGYGEEIVAEMCRGEVELPPDAYIAWMSLRATVESEESAKDVAKVYRRMLTQLLDTDITPELLCSVLGVCLAHVRHKRDGYAALAREVVSGATRLGFQADYHFVTRAMWVFTKAADPEEVRKLKDLAGLAGNALEGHHWEMLKTAREQGGDRATALFMLENELRERNIPFEVQAMQHKGSYQVLPAKVRPHGYARTQPSHMNKETNLSGDALPTPSTPIGF